MCSGNNTHYSNGLSLRVLAVWPPCMNMLLHTPAVQPFPVEQGFPGREACLEQELTHSRRRCMMLGLKLRTVLERHEVQSQETKSKPVHGARGKVRNGRLVSCPSEQWYLPGALD